MKKQIVFILFCILLLPCFSGCGKKSPPEPPKEGNTEVSYVIHHNDSAQLNSIL
jgi:hypothetical protein